MSHILTTTSALLFLATTSVMSDVLEVPADHPTINGAIDAAQDGDEILVGPGVWYENLYIGKQLTITGSGEGVTVIDGSQPEIFSFGSCVVVSGVFTNSSEPVRLQSLTLRNGFGAEIYGVVRGGGIYSEFSNVELNHVTIEECYVDPQNEYDIMGWGGAVCGYGSDYVINDSTLRNNRSFSHGGAIYITGSLVLNNTLITNNVADLEGGAIFAHGIATDVACFDSSICDNQSQFGGALSLKEFGSLGLDRCRVYGNVAQDGAALHMDETPTVITESTFEHNVPETEGTVIRIIDQPGVPGTLFVEISGSLFCEANQGDWREFILEPQPNEFLEVCGLPGDLNYDGVVSGADLSILLSTWGSNEVGTNADLDCDGIVSGSDLSVLLVNWS